MFERPVFGELYCKQYANGGGVIDVTGRSVS
jgi:hypothetical protein